MYCLTPDTICANTTLRPTPPGVILERSEGSGRYQNPIESEILHFVQNDSRWRVFRLSQLVILFGDYAPTILRPTPSCARHRQVSSSSEAKDLGATKTLLRVRFFAPLRMTVVETTILRPTPQTIFSRSHSEHISFTIG
ncbi:MAG: hypothetical protein IKC72_00755 [Clostridia bacterium]|nr:hypothetical protein [Clostridia bacterium]